MSGMNKWKVAFYLAAIFAAVVVNVLVYYVGKAFVIYDPEFAPLADVIVATRA